jgi:predicted glycosyltransferase involved in capsule biosynthesis
MEKQTLSVIVPFRNREEHLEKFMPHMKEFLDRHEIPFHIYVIEQADNKPFNRAKLLNVGYKESSDFDYFCFHDVDMLPIESFYECPEKPIHLAASVEQFNWGLAYETYFGGVTLFPKESLLKINGYSNNYWGWGAEDDDLWNRCMQMRQIPSRLPGKYLSLNHDRNIDHTLWQRNYDYLRSQDTPEARLKVIHTDGINTLEYEKIGDEKLNDYTTKIKVLI